MLLSAAIQYVKVFCCYTYSQYYVHFGSNKETRYTKLRFVGLF